MSSQEFEKARADVGVIDTMIGFPAPREEQAKHYDFIRKQTHDSDSQEWEFPAQYMFKGVPHYDKVDDPVEMLLAKMNQHGITKALTGIAVDGNAKIALERYPDRFIASTNCDPNQGMDAVRKLDEDVRVHGARSVNCWGTGLIPQVPLNDRKTLPIYSTCIHLAIPTSLHPVVPVPPIPLPPHAPSLLHTAS